MGTYPISEKWGRTLFLKLAGKHYNNGVRPHFCHF
jgi:hypothetical protein